MGDKDFSNNTLSWGKVNVMAVTKDGRVINLENCDMKITAEGPKIKRKPYDQTYSMSFEIASPMGALADSFLSGGSYTSQNKARCPRKLKKQLKKKYGGGWNFRWNEIKRY